MKIAIIAGEPSGDLLGSRLMEQIKIQAKTPVEFIGIGGTLMINAGLESAYDMNILAVGGFGWDLISSIPKILFIRHQIIRQIIAANVDLFIGVDAPDFNFYIEKKLKQHSIKTVHYVSPTIWAWRYERIFAIKRSTDLMLCIFPMEPALYAKENIAATFVGHPLADSIELDIDTSKYKKLLNLDGTVFTVLVGSRRLEVKYLAKLFIDACSLITEQIPEATFLFPLVNETTYKLLQDVLQQMQPTFKYQVLLNQTSEAIKASDMVLAKSGTVTLEVALSKKPMIVSYKVGRFTAWLIGRKIKIPYVSQPNIILGKHLVPELIQENATHTNLAHEFIALYHDKVRPQEVIREFYTLHKMLKHDASATAAAAVLALYAINNKLTIS